MLFVCKGNSRKPPIRRKYGHSEVICQGHELTHRPNSESYRKVQYLRRDETVLRSS